jgi:hypothetical protein
LDIYGELAQGLYQTDVPDVVTERIGRVIIETYGVAADFAEERWDRDEVHDALASFRRAELETTLLSLRGVFPGLVSVESVPNAVGNAYHREVYCGRVAATQSKVEAEKGPIREARFRATLARSSQLSLRLLPEQDEPAPDTRLWACFVHMPSDRRVDVPAFIRVAFPFPDGSWEHSVDLYELAPALRDYAQSDELLALRSELRRRRQAM